MNETLDVLLRFLHVTAGVAMVGGILLWSTLVVPSIESRLPREIGGRTLAALFPRVSAYLTWSGVAAILTGFALLIGIFGLSGGLSALASGPYGILLSLGIGAVLVMMALGLSVIQPNGRALIEGRGGAAHRRKLVTASLINVVLAILVLATMAGAVALRT